MQTPAVGQALAGASDLNIHTAVITNTGPGSRIDIDSVVFETQCFHRRCSASDHFLWLALDCT
ncbi:hypothetical protein NEOLEDRAFT_1128551 [Neolentinus lepideus HHB14362 ss-1]|uniref:Uncharacterized protein n=1 Tax=Neolentinus lepideus HHB14362 ss-1 TaxID=1314782 RepID=A0A165V204_9AGAM|nr:hypothetical protein NEOLEDRAFT_1128551 [Neolentinus lepideus HHB14362 ss-1]